MTINTLGFIGFGKLAKTLYHGFKHELDNNKINLLINSRSADDDQSFTYVSKKIILDEADIIILAVKPQQLNEIMPDLSQIDWNQRCLVSLLDGVPLAIYQAKLPNLTHALRVMPNTAAQFQQSMTTFSSLSSTHNDYELFIKSLFSSIGSIIKIDESYMDFSTALCGSGPAFFFQLFQAMISLAEAEGMSSDDARLMINQLAQGLASSLANRKDPIPKLITEICSPQGTTEAGLSYLNKHKLSDLWQSVFQAAKQRSIDLSKDFKSV